MVAPHAGAWIETSLLKANFGKTVMSRPMRARGLKQNQSQPNCRQILSRPMRARGLKPEQNRMDGEGHRGRAPCGRVD